MITVGDVQELRRFLAAAADYQSPPPDEEMEGLVEKLEMEPLFS